MIFPTVMSYLLKFLWFLFSHIPVPVREKREILHHVKIPRYTVLGTDRSVLFRGVLRCIYMYGCNVVPSRCLLGSVEAKITSYSVACPPPPSHPLLLSLAFDSKLAVAMASHLDK